MRTSESKGHWQRYDSSAVLDLKFLLRTRRKTDRNFKSTALGRLAQLVEHLVYTERVGGSSPSPPTGLRCSAASAGKPALSAKAARSKIFSIKQKVRRRPRAAADVVRKRCPR